MLLDLKGLTANLEESQARLTERLDQIVELLETLVALEERGHRGGSPASSPALVVGRPAVTERGTH